MWNRLKMEPTRAISHGVPKGGILKRPWSIFDLKIEVFGRVCISNYIIFVTLAFLLSGCVTIYNPATQKRETLLIDTQSEVALGRDMDRQIQKKMKILQDPKRQNRLDSISTKVSGFSDRKDLTYHFKIIDDKEFNAFAIPGGFIYVNAGLMDATTDDELACVLGHEIGHVAARHSVKKLQANLGYQIVMSIALGLSGQQTMGQAMDIVFNLASLGYSRKDETLADKLAVKYARGAGFDPHGMITFFRKLEEEAKKKGGNLRIEFLSSHPNLQERIKNVEKEISEDTPPLAGLNSSFALLRTRWTILNKVKNLAQ